MGDEQLVHLRVRTGPRMVSRMALDQARIVVEADGDLTPMMGRPWVKDVLPAIFEKKWKVWVSA